MADEPEYVFPILQPKLQQDFFIKYLVFEREYLQKPLELAIGDTDIALIDKELAAYIEPEDLTRLAGTGLRGERFFPVPILLKHNPKLLGYYRLLYGFSQKEFYTKGPFGLVKTLEEQGVISKKSEQYIVPLCKSLISSGHMFLNIINDVSLGIIHDLQLLTLGPQLRGGANTRIGSDATMAMFHLFREIVSDYIISETNKSINIKNSSGRTVIISFASDPDIRLEEVIDSGDLRHLISIEIKGGEDYSNIHNRLGEAEKSHQKARSRGFFEFWTIINVDIDYQVIKKESPTTSRFFNLNHISDPRHSEYQKFRTLLTSICGIK